jgi:hypothetical protein
MQRYSSLGFLIATLLFAFALPGGIASIGRAQSTAGSQGATGSSAQSSASKSGETNGDIGSSPELPRGKKLVLTNGTYQIVREYQRNGDRVRYFSEERHAWEEIPAEMVDWDATAKAEKDAQQASAALLNKIHTQEEAAKIVTALDVDASLPVGQGVFLPPGEGMFLLEGKSVTPMEQVGSQIRRDKANVLKQVLSPIPIVKGKQNVEIPGAKAKIRILASMSPEFYLRESPPDPDNPSTIERTGRPGESGPEVELVRAVVKGNRRRLESIRSMFGQPMGTERKSVALQEWEMAPSVYRFTLGEPLPPGEYALAEILTDGLNLFVWDFGVDGMGSTVEKPRKK